MHIIYPRLDFETTQNAWIILEVKKKILKSQYHASLFPFLSFNSFNNIMKVTMALNKVMVFYDNLECKG